MDFDIENIVNEWFDNLTIKGLNSDSDVDGRIFLIYKCNFNKTTAIGIQAKIN